MSALEKLIFTPDKTKVSIKLGEKEISTHFYSKVGFAEGVQKFIKLGFLTLDEGEKCIYHVGNNPYMAWSNDSGPKTKPKSIANFFPWRKPR